MLGFATVARTTSQSNVSQRVVATVMLRPDMLDGRIGDGLTARSDREVRLTMNATPNPNSLSSMSAGLKRFICSNDGEDTTLFRVRL